VFQRLGASRLYEYASDGDSAGWCALLLGLGEKADADSLGVPASLRDTRGHYLFAPVRPRLATQADVDLLCQTVRQYLDRAFGPRTPLWRFARACLWIPRFEQECLPVFGEPLETYAFAFAGLGSLYALQTDYVPGLCGELFLTAPKLTRVSATETALTLVDHPGAHRLRFASPRHPNAAPTVAPEQVSIDIGGPYGGCLRAAGVVPLARTLPAFGAGVRYAHGPGESPVARTYPVLVPSGAPVLPYHGTFDPLDLFNDGPATDVAGGLLRTAFSLAPGTTAGAPPVLASWLRRHNGRALRLTPLSGPGVPSADGGPGAYDAALVLQPCGTGASPAAYLAPAGDWGVVADDLAPEPLELLLGASALETLRLRPWTRGGVFDRLRFVPGRPAYSSGFPYPAVALDSVPAGELLDGRERTAWVTAVPGDGTPVTYRSQPEGGQLYASGPGGTPVLDFLPTGVALPPAPGFAMPIAPLAGATGPGPTPGEPGELGAWESQVFAPARRAQVRSWGRAAGRVPPLAAPGDGDAPVVATTPQGFLAVLDGGAYRSVTLARSTAGDVAFLNPDAELAALLTANQLFAVVTNPAHLGATGAAGGPTDAPAFLNAVEMAGWTFRADVGRGSTATDYRNVLVLKFCQGSLADRVANPAKWTDADDFSLLADSGDRATALNGLSGWLQDFVAAAAAASRAGDTLYDEFARIAASDTWQGVLVLQADVEPAGLPEQLRGLAAGIDADRFLAHHIGITVTPVGVGDTDGGIGVTGPSSLFGLLDYQHPQYRRNTLGGADPDLPVPLPTDGPYGFDVLRLQARFQNAALADFASRVQLTVGELFGSRVAGAYDARGRAPATAVVLRGDYQRQGDTAAYVFHGRHTTVFALDSNVLTSVAVDRVQLDTLTADAGQDLLRSRFLCWGKLDFAALAASDGSPLDVLSFGSGPGTAPTDRNRGLAFSGLAVELNSPAATPAAVSYTFDATRVALDVSTSTARADSLVPGLALQIDALVAESGERTPADLGYLPVTLNVPAMPLTGPWYGVVHKVTMGTPGALVAKAGFDARLLLAWSADGSARSREYPVHAGLHLPGTAPGARTLSVQGVLKLSFDGAALTCDPVAGDPQRRAFVLRLSNLGLKILGFAKLPPDASIGFFLFGDPQGTGSLGWYAAYRKASAAAPPAALPSAGTGPVRHQDRDQGER
jgi:hypothetical protein